MSIYYFRELVISEYTACLLSLSAAAALIGASSFLVELRVRRTIVDFVKCLLLRDALDRRYLFLHYIKLSLVLLYLWRSRRNFMTFLIVFYAHVSAVHFLNLMERVFFEWTHWLLFLDLHALLHCLTNFAAVNVIGEWVFEEHEVLGVFALLMIGFDDISCFIVLCKQLSAVDLKLNDCFYQRRIVLHHHFHSFEDKVFLNIVANIMKS